ncbi:ComEC/Rec2 family competence protein (plasmid) [Aneurinibacillus sp. Ricciae_BoGa-3]|uniref:ComEC/Rec2 family competence protein n=1 Tax=Aneurinibacillus sp. Ricciae_BoGa-3 TaxID=3022697 RepID=UPI00233FD9CF|nr:ComEC/Rec2 family competence protein [Aneurinibacillus sp. Ricciae_BoGa-3]WCK57208.1 ComEC/Rec2 family competence protein [Aneurinibacillus sp. Ricciae_BoGa-3]
MKKNKLWSIGASLLMSVSLMGCGNTNASADNNYTNSQTAATSAPADTTTASINKMTTSANQGQLKVYYLDVWQGDSILIQTPKGQTVLIDGGNNQMGATVVHDLKNLHINELTAMVSTHPDADHTGGLDSVLHDIKVDSVYAPKVTSNTKTYRDFILGVKRQGLKMKEAKAGLSLGLDGVDAHFVAPVKAYGSDTNPWSAVLRLSYGKNGTFLFTGDAPILSEQDMLASGQLLQANVLKVGHHGSRGSTSQAFLNAVKPKYAVISVGEGNDYGHPTDEVLSRLNANHVDTFRTDEQGTVEAITDGNTIRFETAKTSTQIATTLNRLTTPKSATTGTQHHVTNVSPATHVAKVPTPQTQQVPVSSPKQTQSVSSIEASIDDTQPHDYQTIHLTVTGTTGAPFTATFHYKTKDTVYTGTTGSPIPVRISRATPGFTVNVDVSVESNGHTYTTQTSFTPK